MCCRCDRSTPAPADPRVVIVADGETTGFWTSWKNLIASPSISKDGKPRSVLVLEALEATEGRPGAGEQEGAVSLGRFSYKDDVSPYFDDAGEPWPRFIDDAGNFVVTNAGHASGLRGVYEVFIKKVDDAS